MDERSVDPDPLVEFGRWYERAALAVPAPEAMALATADTDGRPSARMVLLKSWGADGFVFYTNYDGRKSHELAANPEAALLFYWEPLGRQVRIEGSVSMHRPGRVRRVLRHPGRGEPGRCVRIPPEPCRSPIGPSSTRRWSGGRRSSPDARCPRPEWWGGWRVVPRTFEFWQQGDHRLHDRVRYEADGSGWRVERLQP